MDGREGLATLGLLLVSLLWGMTFVAVKSALAEISPLFFLGLRFGIASLCAIALLRSAGTGSPSGGGPSVASGGLRPALLWGVPIGLVLGLSYAAQTVGLVTTTPSRSAFITGLSIILIPIWGWLILRRRAGGEALVGLALALGGIWLLTDPAGGAWTSGDAWTLVCAVLFALHVVLLTRFGATHHVGGLLFSQLVTTAVLGFVGAAWLEDVRFDPTLTVLGALLLTGVLASFVTTLLQLRLQPRVSPARTAVILAMEPVFAALFSFALHGERLGATGWVGGGLVLLGMLVSEAGARLRRSISKAPSTA